ncbi:protein translocase subunit SecDF [Clostridia bacterium]|nr:protein translocase subunit SecDF [Clostridia bacterium]
MKKNVAVFCLAVLSIFCLVAIAFFGIPAINLPGISDMRFGIDIRGGVDAAFSPSDENYKPREDELEAARSIIETRLDAQNILDRDVTIDAAGGYILVRYPWKSGETNFDPRAAIDELGEMAVLTFKDPDGTIVLEGSDVEHTTYGADQQGLGTFEVNLTLKESGRVKFAEATARLIGQRIYIYMDENMISGPTVNSAINDSTCVITGLTSIQEAKVLSERINAGALPFALKATSYNAISPSLGSNALQTMIYAGIVAFSLISLLLILYYRLSGVVAVLSLLLQVVGQLIMLTVPQITITLPGIAGIILSIGMGVDANIIASERIREELRSGKTVDAAVKSGFKMAFSSIFDGNITVLIVAFIMMFLGSGAIISFAYTLLFGIIMNFIAGVLATRIMTTNLSKFKSFRKPTCFLSKGSLAKKDVKVLRFFEKRRVYFIISGAVMLVGIAMIFVNGVRLDIQFTGGSILKYTITDEINADAVVNPDNAVDTIKGIKADGSDALIFGERVISAQITTDYNSTEEKRERRLVINISGGDSLTTDELKLIEDELLKVYPDQQFEPDEVNNVAPYFSQKFLQNGSLAIILSFVLIIVYVAFSFRKVHGLSAGVMALLSLFHDVLVVFFTFVIFQIPIGDSFIAVALTILGYSINDTIVIYDRIRENSANSKEPVETMVNRSISQSFTRSVYTSVAVFASVTIVYIFAFGNGLDSIKSFAFPMAIGTISGCYSSVCIAGPAWTMWQKRREKKKLESQTAKAQ